MQAPISREDTTCPAAVDARALAIMWGAARSFRFRLRLSAGARDFGRLGGRNAAPYGETPHPNPLPQGEREKLVVVVVVVGWHGAFECWGASATIARPNQPKPTGGHPGDRRQWLSRPRLLQPRHTTGGRTVARYDRRQIRRQARR